MNGKENEYRELFLAEALENVVEINRLLTVLEKAPGDKDTINAIFRITHTLKGNAAGMGFVPISEMAHVLEDLFGLIREGKIIFHDDLFSVVYKAVDALSGLVNSIQDGSTVRYKGIKTKIEVLINRSLTENTTHVDEPEVELRNSIFIGAELNRGTNAEIVISQESEDIEDDTDIESKVTFSDLVQVPVRKLDNLLNLVGELIIEKDRILASRSGTTGNNEYSRLSRISAELQYSVMDVRLVQVGFLFNKFHRVVRDAAALERKQVKLKLEGTDTEIDRNVLQVISDSLIHIIRNAVGHGIEDGESRMLAGKSKEGSITLVARNESDAVKIEIIDDGKGLDHDKIKIKAIQKGLISLEESERLSLEDISLLIFEPGFSTSEQVTAISGRGVGMDVVKKTLDSIGGNIQVLSEKGMGTRICLTLPSSMTVKPCLLFNMQKDVYAIPLTYTESVISVYKNKLHRVGGGLVTTYQNRNIPVVFLRDLFDLDGCKNNLQYSFDHTDPGQKLEIVVVNSGAHIAGFIVDKLLQQKEIVEKPLMKPIDKVKHISGVSILGSGNVCLVLNVATMLQSMFSNHQSIQKGSRNFVLN